ncbi:helix-turn-helix domain-containing protein [Streptomyces avicenniae]|uniref:helix-turn-helix domain-containing protein n=1 Tax=Streptomyces avicenniae TaxID=500153 RepID=UPI00069B7808|nr:helix-turn-helix transcriptional regulator [Streptomyces avicenniae]
MGPGAETADLAALLIELKDRSGLSYGVLAKRLHMSASTLHRYCRGEALPPEFATVERFARLCKATPEERAELHRRWISADTARERERKGPRAAPAAPEPVAQAPVAQAPAAQAPVAQAQVAPEPGVFGPPPPVAAPPGGPAPRRPGRPRFALAAVGALAAVVATALLVGLLTSGDGDGGEDTAADDTGAELLDVALSSRTFEPCSGSYLIDLPPTQVPPPPMEAEAADWARALGAVPAEEQAMELTVQAADEAATVVLHDLRVRVTETSDPLPWHLYSGYAACGGGPVRTSAFDVDLDADAPRLTAANGQDDLPLWVDATEPLVFYVDARTDDQAVSWYLELDWSSGEETGTLRVDDGGQPFRTSAVTDQTEWAYMIGGTEWYDTATGEPAGS